VRYVACLAMLKKHQFNIESFGRKEFNGVRT
jgi:hypothetical protein